jgi:Caspase domain
MLYKTVYKFLGFLLLILPMSNVAQAVEDRALIVGISQYTEVNSLRYADADATQYAQYLVQFSNYKKENVDLLLNLDAKKINIETSFQKIADESIKKPIKNFIFIYAGHGVGSKLSYIDGDKENNKDTNVFLVPSDAKLSGGNFFSTANSAVVTNPTFITTDWLSQALSKINAEKITIILDSCYSGNQKFFQALEVEFNKKNNSLAASLTMPKFAYIASSRDDQEASEYDELGHGALSYAFFEFLNIKRRETSFEKVSNVTYIDFSNNVSKLFAEVQIKGKSLDSLHQPVFLGLPNFKKIELESFITIIGGATNDSINKNSKSKLILQTEFDRFKFLVDGMEYKFDNPNVIDIPSGRHLFEFFIPETGYRYSFVRDLVGYQVLNEKISHLGRLNINIKNSSVKDEQLRDGLEIYINGKPYGKHKDFSTNLLAGTHIVEVKFLDAISKKSVEIRPDSPLSIVYNLEPKKEAGGLNKSIRSVLF